MTCWSTEGQKFYPLFHNLLSLLKVRHCRPFVWITFFSFKMLKRLAKSGSVRDVKKIDASASFANVYFQKGKGVRESSNPSVNTKKR